MNTQPTHPTNHAVVVGRLGSFTNGRGGDRKPAKTIARRGDFGRSTRFLLALETPFGEPFELLVDAGNSTRGMEVLEAAAIGDFIAVEGALMLETAGDRRYATSDEDDGRRVREMILRVASICAPAAGEQYSQARVWLEGTVIEPAAFLRHGRFSAAQFGRTLVRASFGAYRLPCDVACLISTEHEAAGYLYRAGNKLQLRGELTRMMTTQYGESVEQAVSKLKHEWQAEKLALAGASPDEQRRALGRYRARRAALLNHARTFVLVSEVSPLDGAEAISFQQARQSRREFARQAQRGGRQAALLQPQQSE